MKINNETKVGILAAISVALLVVGFNFLKGDKIFNRSFELKAVYPNVDGLTVGNPVILNGLRVGQVKSITLDNATGQIEVIFGLEKNVRVPENSLAMIASADLLGSKSIKLERGDSKNMAKSGQVLEGRREDPIQTILINEILPLKDTVALLLGQLERFTVFLNNTMDESMGNKLDLIADNFVTTSKNLAHTSHHVDTLMGGIKSTVNNANAILKNIRNQNETIARVMENTAQFSDTLAASSSDIRRAINRSSEAIDQANRLMRSINEGEGTVGALMKTRELHDKVSQTISDLDELVQKYTEEGITLEHRVRLGKAKDEKYQSRVDALKQEIKNLKGNVDSLKNGN